ncbi:Sensor histidine kinase RcsC [Pseudomonas sp. MM227]|uniref:ATP-binding protein n=1 Tax=Pseudomonas sp. MM227 TaxID=3019968 RepID=UPI00221FDDC5|nr:ATP-binding protein [Pseudomonas sp. MM227]CAI3788122.1 Sensor histidine kinase RcsC [Pseudomonas sp. MM227]
MNASPVGGKVATLIASMDWTDSPLPGPDAWPQSLRTAVDIVTHSPMPMLLLWGTQLCQLYNDAFALLVGSNHPRALGQPVDRIWPELKPFSDPIYAAVMRGEVRAFTEKGFNLPREGHSARVWLDLTYSPIRDENERVAGILVTAIEANERREVSAVGKRTEQELRDSEAHFRMAIELSPAVHWTADANGRTDGESQTERWRQLTGMRSLRPDDDWAQLVHPDDHLPTLDAWHLAVSTGRPYDAEYRLRMADGSYHWMHARALPQLDADGVIRQWFGMTEDVQNRRQVEQALRELNEHLETRVSERTQALAEVNLRLQNEMQERERAEEALRHAQKMEALGQLTGGIAHDFNNMLTGIIGSLDLMQRYIDAGRSSEIKRFSEAAVSSAHRAAGLTHRLLAFSRRQSLDRKRLAPNALVHSLEELFSRTLGEHLQLQLQLAPDVWPVNTDASQLENALLNLVINARDAMPDSGVLTIETANCELDATPEGATLEPVKPGAYVMFRVSDNGSGMSAPVLAKAFDPFFTTKPIGQGTGLGLSMIYGFAQQSGGQVTLQSRPGEGTCVRLYLPRHSEASDDPAEPRTPAVAPMAREGESVLVVEDDPAVRMLVLDVLDELGYAAHSAGEASAALALLDAGLDIDLLVTDVGLPGLNGRQLAEIARQQRPGLKVLFITGYAEKAAERYGFLAEGMDMITKPFSIERLGSKIRDMINLA